MLVHERMIRDPVVIHDDTPIDKAMKIMRDEDEFVVTASLLLDQGLSVRLQATNDFVGMLTDQGLPEHKVGNITMYNMHVIREAILGMFASYGQRPVSLSQ